MNNNIEKKETVQSTGFGWGPGCFGPGCRGFGWGGGCFGPWCGRCYGPWCGPSRCYGPWCGGGNWFW